MMNGLLIIVLVLFLVLMIRGWRIGLLQLLFSLVSIVVLIAVMAFATPHVTSFLKENTGIHTAIEEQCTSLIQSRMESGLENSMEDSSVAGIALPQQITGYLVDTGEEALQNSGVYQMVGTRAADLVLSGISFFTALILAGIVVKVIDRLLGLANRIPVVKGINRTLGLIGGAMEAFILVSLFFLFVALIAGTAGGEALTGLVDDSAFLSWIYYENPIISLFSGA